MHHVGILHNRFLKYDDSNKYALIATQNDNEMIKCSIRACKLLLIKDRIFFFFFGSRKYMHHIRILHIGFHTHDNSKKNMHLQKLNRQQKDHTQ